jgi:dolichol-phosphate mannosyltransferase
MMKTVIIIPTYDERENVAAMAEAVLAEAPDADILFADDNSPDGTGQLLDEIAAKEPRVHVLHREKKEGLGRAYIAGFKWALARDYELICEMDCDFSHDPKALPSLLAAAGRAVSTKPPQDLASSGGSGETALPADLVLGSRYIGGIRVMNWPMSRLLLSTGAAQYVKLILGLPVNDPTGGFKCFKRKVLEAIDLDKITSNGYSFQIEMTHTAWLKGFTIKEVPIIFEDRRAGYSKMRTDIATEAFMMVLKLWARCGFRRSPKAKGGA